MHKAELAYLKCGNQDLSTVVPGGPQPQCSEQQGGFGGMGRICKSLEHIPNIGQLAVKGMWGRWHFEKCELWGAWVAQLGKHPLTSDFGSGRGLVGREIEPHVGGESA